jgi:hypothetical protein
MQPRNVARIKLPEVIREPNTPEGFLFVGSGTNLKTGKPISFRVPDTISKKGLEGIEKHIRMNNPYHSYLVGELQELFE